MEQRPLVSIVIPYWNRAERFGTTLESIARIDYRPLDIILVDNGSTDNAPTMAQTFAEQHAGEGFDVTLLSEPRQGAAIARNTGARAARGTYLYFFDSDDTFSPDFIGDAVAKAESKQADAVMAYTTIEHANGRREERRYLKRIDAARQIITGQIATQSLFFRTTFFHERLTHGWDERLSKWDDWELGIRVTETKGKMAYLTQKSYHIIPQHADSITGTSITQTYDAICRTYNVVSQNVAGNRRLAFALAMHQSITAGFLRQEGDAEKAATVFEAALSHTHTIFEKTLCRILSAYVALKGRGAWRLAVLLSRVS